MNVTAGDEDPGFSNADLKISSCVFEFQTRIGQKVLNHVISSPLLCSSTLASGNVPGFYDFINSIFLKSGEKLNKVATQWAELLGAFIYELLSAPFLIPRSRDELQDRFRLESCAVTSS